MSSSHPSGYPKKSGIGFITIAEVTDVTKVNHTIPGIGMKYVNETTIMMTFRFAEHVQPYQQ